MKLWNILVAVVCGAAGTAAEPTLAWRQASDELGIIVADQAGSMDQSGRDHVEGALHEPMVDHAISGAQNWVCADSSSRNTVSRAYASFTFKDDNCCGGIGGADGMGQRGLTKIWPKSTSTDCSLANSGSQFEGSTGYCLFNA